MKFNKLFRWVVERAVSPAFPFVLCSGAALHGCQECRVCEAVALSGLKCSGCPAPPPQPEGFGQALPRAVAPEQLTGCLPLLQPCRGRPLQKSICFKGRRSIPLSKQSWCLLYFGFFSPFERNSGRALLRSQSRRVWTVCLPALITSWLNEQLFFLALWWR